MCHDRGRARRVARRALPAGPGGMALLTLLIACAGAASCSRSAPAAERVDGGALFAQACARCHAADGSGGLPTVANGPKPIDLTDAGWQRARSDVEIVAAIRNGRGAMPPFEDVLTSEQITSLGSYIRTLTRR